MIQLWQRMFWKCFILDANFMTLVDAILLEKIDAGAFVFEAWNPFMLLLFRRQCKSQTISEIIFRVIYLI